MFFNTYINNFFLRKSCFLLVPAYFLRQWLRDSHVTFPLIVRVENRKDGTKLGLMIVIGVR